MTDSGSRLSRGPLLVALAALCWGLSGGIGGILTDDGWDPVVVSFYRGAIGLVFVAGWLAVRPGGSGFGNPRMWFWAVLAGLGVAGNFSLYFVSISEGSVAVAATLMYCAPVFVYLVSFALGLEQSTAGKWAAVALVMTGVVLLTGAWDVGAGDVTLVAAVTGLLSGLCYAVFIFGFKYAAPHGSPQAILVVAFAVLAAVLFVVGDTGEAADVLQMSSWPLFLVLGILGAGLSFIVYIVGLRDTAPAVAAIVAMVEPVTASLFGVALLDEGLGWLQVLGLVLILVTVTALGARSNPVAEVGGDLAAEGGGDE